jgi:3-hydroxyacyl-CoA dehydrogenase
MRVAGEFLVDQGLTEDDVDGAMVSYGFRKGPFGGKDEGTPSDDITLRLLSALLVEGAACVDEQAVQRPSDIDALAIHGLGFPRRKGGPMRAVQSMGLIGVRHAMRDWAEDSEIWSVPDLLNQAIKDAKGFDLLS